MAQIERAGHRINYLDGGGDGPPLLLVHGFPLKAEMWRAQMEALGNRYRILAPDLMGFGDSDAPEDASLYSMDSYADDLAAILDDAGVKSCLLGGLSMGGYIAFAFLRRHPGRAAALILADTRAEPDDEGGRAKRTAQQEQVAAEGTDPVVEAMVSGPLLSPTTRETKPDVVETVRALMQNPPAGYIGALDAMKRRQDSSADLEGISVPTLVVVGTEDAIAPPEVAEAMTGRIPGARVATIEGAGHLSSLEEPGGFNGAVASFLAEVS